MERTIGLLAFVAGLYLLVGYIEAQDEERRVPTTKSEIIAISQQR